MTDYKPPFAFTGTVKKALVDVTGEAVEDMAAKMKDVSGPPVASGARASSGTFGLHESTPY
jgi:hypothetical protein